MTICIVTTTECPGDEASLHDTYLKNTWVNTVRASAITETVTPTIPMVFRATTSSESYYI